MHVANKTAIDVIGMVITEIKAEGQDTVTKQNVHEQLGLIPEKLPKIEQELKHVETKTIPNEGVKKPLCTHPRRTAPPPMPTKIPEEIAAEKDEEEKKALMKAWIQDRYASSKFKTCEHQVLPTTTGEPL